MAIIKTRSLFLLRFAVLFFFLSFEYYSTLVQAKSIDISSDCNKLKESILLAKHQAHERRRLNYVNSHIETSSFQLIKPRRNILQANESDHLTEDEYYYDEYVPQCNAEGGFEALQCHIKMGYCWCVNNFGQPRLGTSRKLPEKPDCDKSEDTLMRGITSETKGILKADDISPADRIETENGEHIDLIDDINNKGREGGRESRYVAEPKFLVANDCAGSRHSALERASKHKDDAIWIPECDYENPYWYADKQCHRSRICWCVDQITGLPLFMKELLAKHPDLNCTAARLEKQSLANTSNLDTKGYNYDQSIYENFYSQSMIAAINRSRYKNPFLRILKPN